jgi:hypothetical protein
MAVWARGWLVDYVLRAEALLDVVAGDLHVDLRALRVTHFTPPQSIPFRMKDMVDTINFSMIFSTK